MTMKLYNYYRSTASYRVRIALYFKGLEYETIPVHLVNQGGEQHSEDYLNINPQAKVPTLEDNGFIVTQSLAIIDYLEEKYPKPSLYPTDIKARAFCKSIANLIACDIHPLNNLSVLQYLTRQLNITEEQKLSWYQHWVTKGFTALESMLQKSAFPKNYCIETTPSVADICLVAQVYNAKRFNCPMHDYPLIQAINDRCLMLKPFSETSPEIESCA